MAICAIIISTSVRSPFHISEFCGYFSISHGKNINAAQVPWLTVAHLAINPEHCGPAYPLSCTLHFRAFEAHAHRPRRERGDRSLEIQCRANEVRDECYAVGADEFLNKPFDTELLISTMRRMAPQSLDLIKHPASLLH